MKRNISDRRDDISPRIKSTFGARNAHPANGDQGDVPHKTFPNAQLFNTLLVPFHLFQDGRIDRAKGNIVWRKCKRTGKLGLVMGRDPKLETRRTYRNHIGLIKIFLSQMDPVAAQFNGQLPMVIDHQHRAMGSAQITGLC